MRVRKNHLPIVLLSFALLVLGCVITPRAAFPQVGSTELLANVGREPAEVLSRDDPSRGIDLATTYLEKASDPSGKFAYRVNTESGLEGNSYNVIRHAGAMYALAMLYHSHSDPLIANVLVRSAKYLREKYIGPGDRPGQLVAWSRPLPQPAVAELGATGLSLVALAEVDRIRPKTVPLEDLEELGRFARSLQKEDGSFYSKYRPDSGPVLGWESLYYPGEAALGFVALYEQDDSREWLDAASKALMYLARSRAGLSTVPADHWALIATARLLPYCGHDECPVSREELVRHAVQICNSIMAQQMEVPGGVLDGAFDPTGRTTPVATRVEGLLATLEFLPKQDVDLYSRIWASAARGVAFLLRAQIKTGLYAGGLPGAVVPDARGASEIRIDYVQHALCAWLRYQKLLQRK